MNNQQADENKFHETIEMLSQQIKSKQLYVQHLKDSLAKNVDAVNRKIDETEEQVNKLQKQIDVLQLAFDNIDTKQLFCSALNLTHNIYS